MAVIVGPLAPATRQGQPVGGFMTAPTWIDVVSLTGGAAASYTLPPTATVFRCTPTVIPTYGTFNGTATVPSAGVINGTGSFPVGGQTYLVMPAGLNVLSLICAQACVVTIEAWN